jgi:hypothetical protein
MSNLPEISRHPGGLHAGFQLRKIGSGSAH